MRTDSGRLAVSDSSIRSHQRLRGILLIAAFSLSLSAFTLSCSTPQPTPIADPSPTPSMLSTQPTIPLTQTPSSSPPTRTPRPTLTPTPDPTPFPDPPASHMRLTIVYDNTAIDPRLAAEWGFSALIEYNGHRVLFDTGPDGSSLLGNMSILGIDPRSIDAVVISHIHLDHSGGLKPLLETGGNPIIYLPEAAGVMFSEQEYERWSIVLVQEPMEIYPGMLSTGQMPGLELEQGLVVNTPDGIVVVVGCAHPGIVNMIRRASQMVPGEIAWVIGGFHLEGTPWEQVQSIIEDFQVLGVRQVTPCHCTGRQAIRMFTEAYGENALPGGAGQVFVVGAISAP